MMNVNGVTLDAFCSRAHHAGFEVSFTALPGTFIAERARDSDIIVAEFRNQKPTLLTRNGRAISINEIR